MTQQFRAQVGETRLDRFLAGQRVGLTRSQLHPLVVAGWVRLTGQPAKPPHTGRAGHRRRPAERVASGGEPGTGCSMSLAAGEGRAQRLRYLASAVERFLLAQQP